VAAKNLARLWPDFEIGWRTTQYENENGNGWLESQQPRLCPFLGTLYWICW
jgi:hypothetical protein